MKIEKIESEYLEDKKLTSSGCIVRENQISCLHDEEEKKLILLVKRDTKDSFFHLKTECKYCPFCGFSYQPERLNPETSKEDAIV